MSQSIFKIKNYILVFSTCLIATGFFGTASGITPYLSTPAQAATAPTFKIPGVMQGLTTHRQTEISILRSADTIYTYKITPSRHPQAGRAPSQNSAPDKKGQIVVDTLPSLPTQTLSFKIPHTDAVMDILLIRGLRLNQKYSLKIWVTAQKATKATTPASLRKSEVNNGFMVFQQPQLIDTRNFKALNIYNPTPRLIATSCMSLKKKYRAVAQEIWPVLLKQKPDLLFMLGDSVYSKDKKTLLNKIQLQWRKTWKLSDSGRKPPGLWHSFVKTRRQLPLYKAKDLVPVLAIWDDHDYGQKDGHRRYRNKEVALKVFKTFFGPHANAPELKRGVGVSWAFEAFGQRFVGTDARYFRTAPSEALETHWGEEQVQWIQQQLSSPRATWLLKGDQFFGGYHKFDSFEGLHPNDFKQSLEMIAHSPSAVMFVSGDRHLFELMSVKDLGYSTFEVTTSGLHNRVYSNGTSNPRQLKEIGETNHFALFDLKPSTPNTLITELQVIDNKGQTRYKKLLKVKK